VLDRCVVADGTSDVLAASSIRELLPARERRVARA
jgi:hypothetical protein